MENALLSLTAIDLSGLGLYVTSENLYFSWNLIDQLNSHVHICSQKVICELLCCLITSEQSRLSCLSVCLSSIYH